MSQVTCRVGLVIAVIALAVTRSVTALPGEQHARRRQVVSISELEP
jgi:hypothetical protein